MSLWEFWIDVGGTFTDCIARSPEGSLVTAKVLSSGVTKGTIGEVLGPVRFSDLGRVADPPRFWVGHELRILDEVGQPKFRTRVTAFDHRTGSLTTAALLPEALREGAPYELASGEEAPLLAIRSILGLRLDEPIPPVVARLGTTRGTNALLTRRGARTAFVTTKGFADVLLIAYQDRPRLFDLTIQKPAPLFERVVEIDERLDARGNVLRSPDEALVRVQLDALRQAGVESIAICLMHSFANPAHELIVERLARDAGFFEVSTSSRLAPLIKIVSRGDTTVVDAYLNPVLRQYVQSLRQGIGDGQLRLMTSAGGLVDADRFVGKDSILSGPAGGVIGFSRVARRAGFEKAIGFDMGGTSTDVSRFDGNYELEFETKKAGVRIVAPMLSIETVAAGGGSICEFDGAKLVVGPTSAGAEPGPASYGRGGPLTVTDVNLYLGRIVTGRFPFPLDRGAVERRLAALCERIAGTPGGPRYAPAELAEGFVRVANANMVRAIRKISVARGYDPRDYVLVTFGGAGAQHACAIARELGMRRILSHPLAGLLSAYGIGQADVRRFRERAVLQPCTRAQLAALEPLFRELAQAARDDVQADGVAAEAIAPPRRSLDLRYRGIEAAINVALPDDGDYRGQYEALHQQLYGYVHRGREVEIVAARVEVVGVTPEPPEPAGEVEPRRPEPRETTEAWFDNRRLPTPVYLRADLRPGDAFSGPAIICEPTSTVVVEPGFNAEILSRGEILLTDAGASTRARYSAEADPVMLEIFNNLFASIAEQMGLTLQRTSFSTNVKERLDFSCAIFDARGDLVVNAPHIPVHLGAMSETVKRVIADNPEMRPGDVFVTNDPYRGGSHLPDVTVVTPVFLNCGLGIANRGSNDATEAHELEPSQLTDSRRKRIFAPFPPRGGRAGDGGGERDLARKSTPTPDPSPVEGEGRGKCADKNALQERAEVGRAASASSTQQSAVPDPQFPHPVFFTASRAHHAEIGGIVPGSMPPFSKSLAEEGVLIRNFKLVDAGRSREDELRKLLLSGPNPTRAVRDNLADVAAQIAANQTGSARLRELAERYGLSVVQAYMGHIQQAAARQMRLALAAIPDGAYQFTDHLDDGSPIAVQITVAGDGATVDFTGTGPVLGSNLNANRAIVTAAVLYVFRCLIEQEIPLNGGVLAPIQVVLPECLLNPPEHDDPALCPAIVGGNVETSQRVVDVLLGALSVAAASQGTMNNLSFGDDTFGYYETICGGAGATPAADGADAVHTHMTNTRLTDPEVIERRYPVRLLEFSIRRGSGGRIQCAGERGGVSRPVATNESGGVSRAVKNSPLPPGEGQGEGRPPRSSANCPHPSPPPMGDGAARTVSHQAVNPPVAGTMIHRGGDGVVRKFEFLKALRVSLLSERRGPYAPFGLNGGPPGMLGKNTLQRAGRDEIVDLGGKAQLDVQPGDVLTIATPGGGAFGRER